MPGRLHRRAGEFWKRLVHDGAKDQRRTQLRHNHAAVRHRLPGDVESRLEFIRHEPVPTSLPNSENTGYLTPCDHHIPAGMGIELGSGGERVTKVTSRGAMPSLPGLLISGRTSLLLDERRFTLASCFPLARDSPRTTPDTFCNPFRHYSLCPCSFLRYAKNRIQSGRRIRPVPDSGAAAPLLPGMPPRMPVRSRNPGLRGIDPGPVLAKPSTCPSRWTRRLPGRPGSGTPAGRRNARC